MMAQPFTGELFYADGGEAWYEGRHGERRLANAATDDGQARRRHAVARPRRRCSRATRRVAYDRLEKSVRLSRYGTDCYAYAMLAAGHVDLVVEVGLQTYDIVALIPIIEQAGGMITTWDGGPAEDGRRHRRRRDAAASRRGDGDAARAGCSDAVG